MAEHQSSTNQQLPAAGLTSAWGTRTQLRAGILANRLAVLLPIAIILLALTARLVPGPRTIDDAYITFRYARNILAGNGFVYNPGERVLGTTTPLFAFLLTALGAVSGGTQAPFPMLALVVNALADAITCLLLLRLGQRFGSSLAGAGAALVWAVAPYSVTFAIGGLETSLYVLLLVATAYAYISKRTSTAAVTAALSLLTRPDALLLVAPLVFDRLLSFWRSVRSSPAGSSPSATSTATNKGIFFREILPFALPLLAWFAFATLYFGTPIPHSVAAKGLAYRLGPGEGLIRLMQHYATPFLGHQTFGNRWIGVGLILYPFLYLIGVRHVLRINKRAWPVLVFPWFYFAAFAIANPLIFRWYLTPPLPIYMLAILVGLERLIEDVRGAVEKWKVGRVEAARTDRRGLFFGDRRGLPTEPLPAHDRRDLSTGHLFQSTNLPIYQFLLIFFLILAPFILISQDWKLRPDHGLHSPAPDMAWYQLELRYREAAQFLEPYHIEDSVLAAGDVGVLGYFTHAQILDLVGLNSPDTLQYYPIDPEFYSINYAVSPDLILDKRPDYIVILEIYAREGLLQDQRFWNRYRLIKEIQTDIYGSNGMLIFQNKESS